ncbi:MAG: CHASE2 domain-containing protein [Symploca sp. SIO2D2]|nr:CHASE2 domain-containing protein [Symploca sp. SIO2D2]
MSQNHIFELEVEKLGKICRFTLSVQGKRISSQELDYPLSLKRSYQEWQQAYLNCYCKFHHSRGKVITSGSFSTPTPDREKVLRDAEAQLLSDFHRWLRSEQLHAIRDEISHAAFYPTNSEGQWVEVFLTCKNPELERLPWEAWEINTKLSAPGTKSIRIAHVPRNLHYAPVAPLRRKARVLAILGDEKGLNFKEEKRALRNFSQIAEVEFCGWQQGKDNSRLKEKIAEKISDRRGWDILFFAGHSNETALTGGELGIAPGVSLSMKELEPSLHEARSHGLQFAIFNSCDGISIAESLINLGLPQVVVMREPIHNDVAQEFLVQFLQSLTQYKDVHEAVLDACAFLKEEKLLTYPSAYLVPSLFRHPEAELFRLEPFGLWHSVKNWLPTKREAIWLSALLLLSLFPPLQDLLLEPRLLLQAAYRQVVVGEKEADSPILLVQIDNKSLQEDNVELVNEKYLDYSYLAKILAELTKRKAQVVGVDYILDQDKEQPEKSQKLKETVDVAVKQGTWLVWGAYEEDTVRVSANIASLQQTMVGDISSYDWYMELPKQNCTKTCPFAYLLALSGTLFNSDTANLPQPEESQTDFRTSVVNFNPGNNQQVSFLQKLRLSANFLFWFPPIIDYSLPPEQVYTTISACELLGSCESEATEELTNSLPPIVMIVPGGYEKAGVDNPGQDNALAPLPVVFWRGADGWSDFGDGKRSFTGGETHGYMVYQYLNQHLVVMVPSFLLVLLAAGLGKGLILLIQSNPDTWRLWLIRFGIATVVYLLVSLQVYLSLAVVLPLFWPLVTLGNYFRLGFKKPGFSS